SGSTHPGTTARSSVTSGHWPRSASTPTSTNQKPSAANRSPSGTITTTTVSLGAAGLELAGRVSTVLLPCRGRGSYNYSPSRGAFRWTCPAPAWGGRREPGPLRWLDQKTVRPRLLGEVVAHHSNAPK